MKVVEIFESINGEGMRAGELAVFVRMKGCNLSCNYCDTKWANEKDASFTMMTAKEVYSRIKDTDISNVTLTGGEPLLQEDMGELLELLVSDDDIRVEIETNGSVNVEKFRKISQKISFTIDYKTTASGMNSLMCMDNFKNVCSNDTVKFVVSDRDDLNQMLDIVKKYDLEKKCHVIVSSVFERIEPKEIVEFMLEKKLNDIRLQLQLHKFIWDPQARGV